MQPKTDRADRAAIHAARMTRDSGKTRARQDQAALYAKNLVITGHHYADAVRQGHRLGISTQGATHA